MKKFFLFFVFIYCSETNAQENNVQKGFFSFQYDNDFFNATDRYFTQGIRLELAHTGLARTYMSRAMVQLKNSTYTLAGIALEQQCFTPRSIRVDSIQKGERPYSAVMFATFFLNSYNVDRDEAVSSRADIGVIGPCAVCEQEQKGLHKALNNIQPLGWEYQLNNGLVLNYSVQYEKAFYSRRYLAFAGLGRMRAGTLYTDAAAGLHFQAGWMPALFSAPLRQQPFRFYAFAIAEARTVRYNTTLQGNLFGKNDLYVLPGSAIERLVYKGTCGLVLAWKRLSLEYTRIFITREFKGGLSHGWGHCDIRIAF